MDEEVNDSVFGQSDAETSETKPKKKAAPAKKKAGKEAAPTKNKAAPASKKANEAVPMKKVNGEAPAKKANNEAEKPKKKTTLDLVCEAIEISGESRKGLSVQAIKKYIISKTEPVPANLNKLINKALSKGIETGILERPAASKDASGATGHFRLAKLKPLKRTKPVAKRAKINSEHASDSEATEKPVKPRKRNLSDTYIAEMKKSLTSTPKPSIKTAPPLKGAKQTKNVPKNPKNKKDTSDSKIEVKETKRKAVKSYSSDTEVDLKKVKTTKPSKAPVKKAPSDKAKTAKGGSPSKESKAKVKKLYSDGKTKSAKKTKKQE